MSHCKNSIATMTLQRHCVISSPFGKVLPVNAIINFKLNCGTLIQCMNYHLTSMLIRQTIQVISAELI